MMSDLLKQLVNALGLFIRYRLSRLFGRPSYEPKEPREPTGPVVESDMSTPIESPSLDVKDLDPRYHRIIRWRTDQSDVSTLEIASNPIYQLWREMPQSPKWTHYFEAYQAIFETRRSAPLRILEIGVFQGASLRLWKNYFHNSETSVVGIDIDPACEQFDSPSERIHVRIGSQADAKFLDHVVQEFGPFDLIIDDGSHHSSHMITSFNCLYAEGLTENGIYFVEDLHANYWLPWRDSANSFLDFSKELLELMHAHYRKALLSDWTRETQSGTSLVVEVPEITTMIKEIRFFDSIVAIYKMRRAHPPRYIVG